MPKHKNETYWPRHTSLSVNLEGFRAYEEQPPYLRSLRYKLFHSREIRIIAKEYNPRNKSTTWVVQTDCQPEPLKIPAILGQKIIEPKNGHFHLYTSHIRHR